MAAGGLDILRIGIQSVNEIAFIDLQISCQPAVTATDVDDQSTLNAGELDNSPTGLAVSRKR